MRKSEFTPYDIEKAVSHITSRKVLSQPKYLEKGYGNENWMVETDLGMLICKIGPKNALVNKWKSTIKAIEIAKSIGVPTNKLISFEENCSFLSNRVVRIFEWVNGISVADIMDSPHKRNKFFMQLGLAVRKLHGQHLDYFSSRLDGSSAQFKSWQDYLNYRISQIHERAVKSGLFDEEKLHDLWNQIKYELELIDHLIYPTLTHRDLHLDNLVATLEGELAAIIDFDGAEAWDPVADFFKLKWWIFETYPSAEEAFIKGYGNPESLYPFFKKRLFIIEIIELINTIAQDELEVDIKMDSHALSKVLKEECWDLPLKLEI